MPPPIPTYGTVHSFVPLFGSIEDLDDIEFQLASLRGIPPGLGGAALGVVSQLVPNLVWALRDGSISGQEWTVIALTTVIGGALGAAGVMVDPSLVTATAQWVWRLGVAATSSGLGPMFRT